MSCVAGRRCSSSDPVLLWLWLWHGLATAALIRSLAWEVPYVCHRCGTPPKEKIRILQQYRNTKLNFEPLLGPTSSSKGFSPPPTPKASASISDHSQYRLPQGGTSPTANCYHPALEKVAAGVKMEGSCLQAVLGHLACLKVLRLCVCACIHTCLLCLIKFIMRLVSNSN